ncbi:MAG TPA: alpha/beta fold hydrolase [Rhodospirillaceae bacterium]|nr:alpha/beta fold hydrolase [Rhodospirillaceae bacterium]
MKRKAAWEVEGRNWPNREASRFVKAAGITWHVQVMGSGPVMLLLHGTGAATHSWRALAPLLGQDFAVVAPDLPGHGFTGMDHRRRPSLPHMAADLARLLAALDMEPAFVVGHSAGAAIALRMVLDGLIKPRAVVGLNGAFMPFSGLEGALFPMLARFLFVNPIAASLLAWHASDRTAVARVIEQTGSHLDPAGLELYVRLLGTSRHVEAALGMMANWDLRPLQRDLPRLSVPLTLFAAQLDHAVPPRVARETAARVAGATVVDLPGYGHLAHEEAPGLLAELILKACI